MVDAVNRNEAVSFSNALLKRNTYTNTMEAKLTERTSILRSPQKMNVQTHTDATPQIPLEILLKDLQKQVPGQMVDIAAKVLDVSDVTYSRKDHTTPIRKVGISDESASATATLWGNFTSQVQMGRSYAFCLAVKSGLDDDMVLYTSKNGCEIKPVQDIGEVAPLTHFKKETHNLFKNATVIGVNNFKSYYACAACDNGEAFLIEPTEPYVRCNSCGNSSHVRHSSREISAYLTLQNDDSVRVQLTATSTTISKIPRKPISDITQYTLLDVPKFNVEYSRYQSIVDVSYPQETSSPKRHARRNLSEEMASEGQQSPLQINDACNQETLQTTTNDDEADGEREDTLSDLSTTLPTRQQSALSSRKSPSRRRQTTHRRSASVLQLDAPSVFPK